MKNKLFSPMAGYMLFAALLMCSTVFLGLIAGNLSFPEEKSEALPSEIQVTAPIDPIEEKTKISLMLDPGHGGEDGGASSADGTAEKDLNLSVSFAISDLSMLFGIPCSMTREDDRLLYDYYNEATDYTGKKKSLDLKNRLRLTEESDADLLVSIHMNKFSDPRYSGLQIYYSEGDDSRSLAGVLQSYVKSHLQKENSRQPKAAGSSIYLLKNIRIPALLVECGFLSSPEEAALLKTKEYRASLACTLFTPIAEYLVRQE